jgi:hypothetical protein
MDSAYMSGYHRSRRLGDWWVGFIRNDLAYPAPQERARRSAQAMTRREHLYGEFIDEAFSSTIHQSLPVFRRLSGICGSALLPRSS